VSYWSSDRHTARTAQAAFRPSALFLCLVAVFVTSGVMAWMNFGTAQVNVVLFVVCGWLVSLCLHEYGHALMAYRSGDLEVADRGYLTLNPLRYTHWFLSLVLPLIFLFIGGFGLPGGAVWINHSHVRSRWRESLISLAGPLLNVAFTIVTVLPFVLGLDNSGHEVFWAALAFLGFLQLTASVLNLAPVPGMDGGNALRPWLPDQWRRGFDLIAPYGMLLFFALLFNPTVGGLFFDLIFEVGNAIGLPLDWVAVGRRLFLFWRY
jgi:Zn-dependent protease